MTSPSPSPMISSRRGRANLPMPPTTRRRAPRPRSCRRSITRNGARSGSAPRPPCSATDPAAFRSCSSISACSFRRRSRCTSSKAACRSGSSTNKPISICRPIRLRGSCRRARALRGCASRRRATGRSTGARTTGSPFSARPISVRSANCGNTGFPPAGSRSTLRSPTGRRNFRTSPISTSTRCRPTTP